MIHPNQPPLRRATLFLVGQIILLAFGVNAQKKAPPTQASAYQKAIDGMREAIPPFRDAYEEDDYPFVMVTVALDGRTAANPGKPLLSFDPSGTSESVRAEMVRWLRRNRSIELLDFKNLAKKELQAATAIASEQGRSAAQAMLAEKSSADLLFYVELREIPNDLHAESGHRDTGFRVYHSLFDRRTSEELFAGSHTWRAGTGDRDIQFNTLLFLKHQISEYTAWVNERPTAQPVRLSVLGLEEQRDGIMVRRLMENIPGVQGRIRFDWTTRDDETAGMYVVRTRSDATSFVFDLNESLRAEMETKLRVIKTTPDLVTVIAEPYKNEPPAWVCWTDRDHPKYKEHITRLDEAYTRQNRPAIAVVPNRNGIHSLGQLKPLQAELSAVLTKTGLSVVMADPLAKHELVQAPFEIVMFVEANPNSKHEYTFSLFDVRNNRFIATQRWPEPSVLRRGPNRVDADSPAEIATFLGGVLIDGLFANYLEQPAVTRAIVYNLSDQRVLTTFARTLEDNIPAVLSTSRISVTDNCGGFDLRYGGSFNSLIERIENNADRLKRVPDRHAAGQRNHRIRPTSTGPDAGGYQDSCREPLSAAC